MDVVRSISADEMIAEFLKAELDSSRFRQGSLKALGMLGYDTSLLENPDTVDVPENQKRSKVLRLTRGWPDEWLFAGFPENTTWHFVKMSQQKIRQCYRLKSRPDMPEQDRLLANTARSLKKGEEVENIDSELIEQMVSKIKQQQFMPPSILVSEDFTSKTVLIEGHSRSTAYCFIDESCLPNGIPAILGTNPNMSQWVYY